jgi:hypothetical protein
LEITTWAWAHSRDQGEAGWCRYVYHHIKSFRESNALPVKEAAD